WTPLFASEQGRPYDGDEPVMAGVALGQFRACRINHWHASLRNLVRLPGTETQSARYDRARIRGRRHRAVSVVRESGVALRDRRRQRVPAVCVFLRVLSRRVYAAAAPQDGDPSCNGAPARAGRTIMAVRLGYLVSHPVQYQ